MKEKRVVNHKTDGEIGNVFNHHVTDAVGRVVNHDLADCSSPDELARILGVYKYPGRVLGSTGPHDVVFLNIALKRPYEEFIRDHYRRIGLEHSENIIWDDDFAGLRDYPDHKLSVFFFGKKAHAVCPDKKWYDITEKMNSKNEFIKMAKSLKIPVPKTDCFDTKEDVSDSFFDIDRYPCFLKMSVSASGAGVIKCHGPQELFRHIKNLPSGVPFQVQENIYTNVFINLQYEVVDRNGIFGLKRLAMSEQILDGNEHVGNITNFDHMEAWAYTDGMAQKIYESGMQGVFAFDLAVVPDGYLLIECNPRYNGSTYPTKIAQKLGVSTWMSKNFKTAYRSYQDIDITRIEYDPRKKSGVVFLNWGCIDDGKIGVMLIGTESEMNMLEQRLHRILNP